MSTESPLLRLALDYLWSVEGGYVNDPADRGGETRYGISAAAHPGVDIGALTRDAAAEIYCREYWVPAGCDALPPRIAVAVFDHAVHSGPVTAVQCLQRAVGVSADGLCGRVTQAAARDSNHGSVIVQMLGERGYRFFSIATSDSSQRKYVRGWLARTYRLLHYVLTEVPE